MRRSVESSQRKVRILAINIASDGASHSGINANDVTVADTGTGIKTVTLKQAFADADYTVVVTSATSDSIARAVVTSASSFRIDSYDATDGTTAKDAYIYCMVIGSDVTDRY